MTNMTNSASQQTESTSFGGKFARKFPLLSRVALVGIWLEGIFIATLGIVRPFVANQLGGDAHAYWVAGRGQAVYDKAPGQIDAYLYSPAFTALVHPLSMLPWPVFLTAWICLQSALLSWLLRPLRIRWAVPIFLLCVPELINGNIYILIAASAVLGFRYSAAWAFPILTKVTTGIGLLWFVIRGDWLRVAQGAGTLAAITTLSYLFTPGQWHAWFEFLFAHSEGTRDGTVSFVIRCLVAALLIVVGARNQWYWLVAPALVLAAPVLALTTLTMLTAIPRLIGRADLEPKLAPSTTTIG